MLRTLSLSLISAAALAATASAQVYVPQNDLLVIQMESSGAPGAWDESTATSGFTGDSYIVWEGANQFNTPGQGVFGYDFEVENGGEWILRIRNRHEDPDPTEENDVWARMDGGTWIKTFSNDVGSVGAWTWESTFELGHGSFSQAHWDLSPGTHRIEFSGRSNGFKMDRFHLHRPNASGSMDVNQPVSPQRFTDNYGSANANSTGQTGIMEALGSPVVSDNELVLTGRRLPAGSFGFFITSRNQGFAANPGGSSGNLLLGGNVGRYSSTINTVTAAGTASLQLDLTNMPTPSGTTSAMAGQQWNFQFWHRDTNGSGGVTSNFSRGLALTFE